MLSILGLLDSLTEGNSWIHADAVANHSSWFRTRILNREIGFAFQAFDLIGDLTVFENGEVPLTYRRTMASERKQRIHAVLERIDMEHQANLCVLCRSGC